MFPPPPNNTPVSSSAITPSTTQQGTANVNQVQFTNPGALQQGPSGRTTSRKHLHKKQPLIKLLYINAGSVKNKYTYINDYIHTHAFGIVAICETWLGNSDYDDTCINGLMSDNYIIYRVDRDDGRRGGGVALIYKNSLKIKTRAGKNHDFFKKVMTFFTCFI